ncbi:MAG TPA: hypothetical protein PL037_07395 [Elusimicrobiales bacterium]|nr:hypothetical protein [Elusimicrobiales bacterium]
MMRKTEQRLADMVNDLDSRLTAFEIDFKKMHLYISSTEESINSLYLNVKRDMLTVLKEAIKDADSAITGHMLALTAKLEEMFRKGSEEAAGRIRAESDRNAEKIKEFSGLSARNISSAAFLAGNLDEMSARLEKLKTEVKTFSDGLGNADMAALLGVSGDVARKNYEGLRASLKDLESELVSFRARKDELKENLRKLAGGGS